MPYAKTFDNLRILNNFHRITPAGLGMSQPLGHIDFYPNGGELMPGCSNNKGHPSDLDSIWDGKIHFQVRGFSVFRFSMTH